MRMKCFRILPEIWARMTCLLESSTRNMAFGRVSRTTPSASNMSCLGIGILLVGGRRDPLGLSRPHAQDLRTALGQGHRVLVVSGQAPVLGHGRPAVLEDLDLPVPRSD